MAAFHDTSLDWENEAYSPWGRPTIAAAALALLGLGTAAVLLAVPPTRPTALAVAVSALSAPLGAALGSLPRGASRSAALCAIVGIGLEALFLGVLGDAARALPLGALALALILAGAGVARFAARRGFASLAPVMIGAVTSLLCVTPFVLANENASMAQLEWARRLFLLGPLSHAAGAVDADLLRNGHLYSISALGSSLPLGYPPPWLQGAFLGAVGLALHFLTRAPAAAARPAEIR
jgi:hypothetical protein